MPARSKQPVALPPSQASVTLEGAMVGQDYSADLPPFRSGADPHGLALHPVPNPPEGLTFADSGSGFSQLSGRPTKAGAFTFDVVATNSAGLSGRMNVAIQVAPSVQPQPTATPTHIDAATGFLRSYDGGSCFFVRPQTSGGDGKSLIAAAADKNAFPRFEAGFKRAVGYEPRIIAKLIVPPECAALDLLKLSLDSAAPPRIDLVNPDVGSGRPLAGTISGVAGRKLVLLVIDNVGATHRLPFNMAPSGDAASFSVPLTGDATSIGPLQVVLAIVSDSSLPTLEAFRPMPASDLAAKLNSEWAGAGATAAAEFFKLAK